MYKIKRLLFTLILNHEKCNYGVIYSVVEIRRYCIENNILYYMKYYVVFTSTNNFFIPKKVLFDLFYIIYNTNIIIYIIYINFIIP